MKWTYLLVNLFSVIIPFFFSFHSKINFYKNFRSFFLSNIFIAVLFICWDILFSKIGVWGFNPDYVVGTYIFNLPIEEILFFVCIPFACIFTYHCLNYFFKLQWSAKTERIFVQGLSFLLILSGIYFHSKLYTSCTFISLGILLLILKYVFKVTWLVKLVLIYPVLLIPFFIVNGILTGTGLQHPVVWYNDEENLGMRILSIPVEDVFYGFELLLLNISLFEYFKKRLNNPEICYDEQSIY